MTSLRSRHRGPTTPGGFNYMGASCKEQFESIEATEAFKIENGLIRRIEMIGPSVPFHLTPAWGGLSGR